MQHLCSRDCKGYKEKNHFSQCSSLCVALNKWTTFLENNTLVKNVPKVFCHSYEVQWPLTDQIIFLHRWWWSRWVICRRVLCVLFLFLFLVFLNCGGVNSCVDVCSKWTCVRKCCTLVWYASYALCSYPSVSETSRAARGCSLGCLHFVHGSAWTYNCVRFFCIMWKRGASILLWVCEFGSENLLWSLNCFSWMLVLLRFL